MNKYIKLLLITSTVFLAGCELEKIQPINCVDKGVVLDLTDYEYNFNPRCNVKTNIGVFRLANQDVCDEVIYNNTIFKCERGMRYVWTQEVKE